MASDEHYLTLAMSWQIRMSCLCGVWIMGKR